MEPRKKTLKKEEETGEMSNILVVGAGVVLFLIIVGFWYLVLK